MKWTPILVIALFAGCAYHPPHALLAPQTRFGPAEDLGLSISEVAGRDVDYFLDESAYVMAIRVVDPDYIEVVAPAYGPDKSTPGHHYVRAGGPSRYVTVYERRPPSGMIGCYEDQPGSCDAVDAYSYLDSPPESPPAGYWLLIVSDVPTPNDEVVRRLEQLNRFDMSVENLVRAIPEALIASRTTNWVAYYAPFGQPQSP